MMKDSNILNYVLLEVTDKCNLACRHCRVENLNCVSNPLTKEEIFKIIKTSSKLGAKVITFSGGEPLLRSDITALVDCASKNGLKPRIQSNGYLINKKIIQDLKNAGLKTLGIGLDGSKSEIHNWLRRNNKAFNKTLNAIKLTREAGIDVHVESTITKFNQADVENIIDLAEKVGASTFLTRCVIAVGKANTNLMVSKKENKDLLNRIMKKKYKMKRMTVTSQDPLFHLADKKLICLLCKKYGKLNSDRFIGGCIAGFNSLNIKPNGDVKICTFLPVVIGNIRKRKLEDIWKDKNKIVAKFTKRKIKGKCKMCTDRYICGGCRARALALNNDILSEDPYCWL